MKFRTFLLGVTCGLALYLGGKPTYNIIEKYLTQSVKERIVQGVCVKPDAADKKYVEVFVQDPIFPKGRFEARACSSSLEIIIIPDSAYIPEARIQENRLNFIRIDLRVPPHLDITELVEAGAKVSPYDTTQSASDGIYDRNQLLNKINGLGASHK
ncbi:MAG: hypothetical protein Q7K43_02230 [Candidatus Woesearchaeota archaeon]|nr:hypothetical protein [Candidatus Woesearchaeota archaeon]